MFGMVFPISMIARIVVMASGSTCRNPIFEWARNTNWMLLNLVASARAWVGVIHRASTMMWVTDGVQVHSRDRTTSSYFVTCSSWAMTPIDSSTATLCRALQASPPAVYGSVFGSDPALEDL